MRERFCKVCKGWHRLDQPWPHNCRQEDWRQRSDLPGPMLIRDEIDHVQSMATGKWYSSKAKLRQEYKDLGMIEVGNDPIVTQPTPFKRKKPTKEDVTPAVERALSKAGFGA